MSIEITGIVGQVGPPAGRLGAEAVGAPRPTTAEVPINTPDIDIDQIAEDLEVVSRAFNRRLKFTVNKELNQVVVKVIDKETDKVIKELPPEEVQRLHVRIREAIGLLIDEEI
jgi:flagellar protein FlaG